MPKKIHEIKTFLSGTITTPDSKDIPEDAAESSLNIDPVSSDGRLLGIGTDDEIISKLDESSYNEFDTMGMINYNGERILVGANVDENTIHTIRNLYNEDNISISSDAVGSIKEASLVIDNNQAYIGLGGDNLASRPQFAGLVTNNTFSDSVNNSILVENAEAKPLEAGYYGIRKVATTVPATSVAGLTPSGNTAATEDDYLWGLAPDEKFLFRITVSDATKGSSGDDGTLTPSDYIKDSDGVVINTTIMSIATCISQDNMLWATTRDGRILRLHVNASTLSITIETVIVPKFLKVDEEINDVGSSMVNSHNFNNKPPPSNAVLSDIIEARSADSDVSNHDLIISYWIEDGTGFAPRDSYMYKKSINNWNRDDTAGDTDEPIIHIDTPSIDGSDNVLTRYVNDNALFKDISIIFDEYNTRTTQMGGVSTIVACRDNSGGNVILSNLRLGEDEGEIGSGISEDITNPHPSGYFENGTTYVGYEDLEYRDQLHYDYSDDSPNDDGVYTPVYYTENNPATNKHLLAINVDDGKVYDLGSNIGFEEGFRLRVHRFGLIACNESDVDITEDVLVHLYATSDKKFCISAGKIVRYRFPYYQSGQVIYYKERFFGVPGHGIEEEHFNNGFFITVNTSKKEHPKHAHNAAEDDDITDVIMATNSIPWGDFNNTDGGSESVGSCFLNILSKNSAIPSDGLGGYSWLSPSGVESIVMDRFGNRASGSLTTSSNYKTPANYENLAFISERQPVPPNEPTSNRFWSVDFDTIDLEKSDSYTYNRLYGDFTNGFEDLVDGQNYSAHTYYRGFDFLKQGRQASSTYMDYKDEANVAGACIFSVFGSAATVGGAGANLFQTWYFSLYTTDSNNYSNGILPLTAEATHYNDWGTLDEDKTTYSLVDFSEVVGGANNFVSGAKCFYKIALVYDNGAISKLNLQQSEYTTSAACDYVILDIKLSASDLSRRVTAIQVYRRGGDTEGDESTQWYLAVNDIPLSTGWTPIFNGQDEIIYYVKRIYDTNSNILNTYEKNSGLTSSEVTIHTLPNYSLSTVCNNFNIIGKCYIPDMDNLTNYLFKSLAGRYNSFNISDLDSFTKLPTTPTALASFNGRLFAFDENNTYIINTEYMIIEDELEGIGCLSQNSVVTTEFGMFFADDSNIYHYTGKETIPIANSILKTRSGKQGWLERYKTARDKPTLIFDGNKLSLIVLYKQKQQMSEEEAIQYVNEILLDNTLGLDVLDIVNQVSPNAALVYNLKNRRWDMWEAPNLTNIHSGISGKDGEPIISSQENIVFYTTNEEDRRDWESTSKNITLGIDGKKKKFYKVLTQSNIDDDITEYSLDNGEFQVGDTINKKAKSIQLRIKSQDNIDAEVDSITLTYRDLPTSKKNV